MLTPKEIEQIKRRLKRAAEADNLRRARDGTNAKAAAKSNKGLRKSMQGSKKVKQDALVKGRPLPGSAFSKSR